MRVTRSRILGAASFFLMATPAMAEQVNGQVAEPNPVTLLSIAVAGILIGRRMAAKRPTRD